MLFVPSRGASRNVSSGSTTGFGDANLYDRVAQVCGDQVRQLMLSRGIKLTRADVERLAKSEPAEQEQIIAEVLQTGKRPNPAATGPNLVVLSLPVDQPDAQASILERRLGHDATVNLYQALGKHFQGQDQACPGHKPDSFAAKSQGRKQVSKEKLVETEKPVPTAADPVGQPPRAAE